MFDQDVKKSGGGREFTGYPSIDRPWSRYYRSKPVRVFDAEQTIYDFIFESNKDNLDAPAIRYYDLEWSFGELKEKVDYAASAFYSSGVRCGDVFLIALMNCPESVIVLLALNKLGAVSKWIDLRAGEKDIEKYIIESKVKYVITLDMLLVNVQKAMEKTEVASVLVLNTSDVPLSDNSKISLFWEYLEAHYDGTEVSGVSFDKERPSIMVMSSGTTGKSKVIVHSDYSVTSAVSKLVWSDLPVYQGKKVFAALPPWIAYDLEMAITYPLAVGATCILGPTFDEDALVPFLGKYTVAFAAPFHYRYLYNHFSEICDEQKAFIAESIDAFITGGDKISLDECERFEKLFGTPIINGYGNNEGWACLTVNNLKSNKYGSVGIPKYGDIMISYDNENNVEMKYDEVGEICFLTDTVFMYYENTKENPIMKKHSDGKYWLHTGDLGYISEDGYLFLQGRLRRVIIRGGFKISAYTIEDKICEHPIVKECVAVEVPDPIDEHAPMVFVVIREECGLSDIEAEKELYEKCKKELKLNEIPKYFRFVDSLPYTENGKYDFRLLEQKGTEYVNKLNTQD